MAVMLGEGNDWFIIELIGNQFISVFAGPPEYCSPECCQTFIYEIRM